MSIRLLVGPNKLPGDIDRRTVDLSDSLFSGETITAQVGSATVSPSEVGGLAVDDVQVSGTSLLITFSAGNTNTDYTIGITYQTSNSRKLTVNLLVEVRD